MRGNFSALREKIYELSKKLREQTNIKSVNAVSFGFPGLIFEGKLRFSAPLGVKEAIDIKDYFKELGRKIFIENDLKLAARAELFYGLGKLKKNFYLLSFSTGIGTGIVINGKVLEGYRGEFGHDVLDRNSEYKCPCGNCGCWETMSSGYGIEENFREGKLDNEKRTAKDIFTIAEAGNEHAQVLINRVRNHNAHGIGNMLNAFSVEAIVIMGTLGLEQFKKIIPTSEEIKKYTVQLDPFPEIVPTSLGKDIGIIGAYIHACI